MLDSKRKILSQPVGYIPGLVLKKRCPVAGLNKKKGVFVPVFLDGEGVSSQPLHQFRSRRDAGTGGSTGTKKQNRTRDLLVAEKGSECLDRSSMLFVVHSLVGRCLTEKLRPLHRLVAGGWLMLPTTKTLIGHFP